MAGEIIGLSREKNQANDSQADQPVLRLAFACTRAENSEAATYVLRGQLGGGSKWLTRLVLLMIAAGLILRIVSMARTMSGSDRWIWGSALIVIWMVLFVIIRRRGRSTHAIQMDIFDWGFRISAAKEEVVHPWGSLSRAVETPTTIVLQVARGSHFFAVPKRVLPSTDWWSWLVDTVAANKADDLSQAAARPPVLPASHEAECILSVEYGRSFGNAMNLVLASWFTKLLSLGWIGMHLGITIYMVFNPSPDAVVPLWKVFLCFEIPTMIVGWAFLIFALAVKTWLRDLRQPTQRISLFAAKIIVQSGEVVQTLPWSAFTHFKETRGNFLLWGRFSAKVLVIPKLEKVALSQEAACRSLLVRKLKESRWVWSV